MEVISHDTKFDFMKYRYIWVGISYLMVAYSIFLWFQTGDEKYGVDFRGGTELVVQFNSETKVGDLRAALEKSGFKEVIVQDFASKDATSKSQFSIRLSQSESSAEGKKKLYDAISAANTAGYTVLKEDFVGPVIGEQIRKDGIKAIIISLFAIMAYVWVRFEWHYGAGGVFALLHDVIIVVGACLLTGRQMNAGILAAVLTIIGYSINDTIIVYDRIRENDAKSLKAKGGKETETLKNMTLLELMNLSINQTLRRTIITSLTVFVVVFMLYLFGGGAVSDLAFALTVGVAVGTYSSIFVACPLVASLQRFAAK